MFQKKQYEYILKSLYYLSLVFAVYYLYKNNFLDNLLQLENYYLLSVSLVILFTAQLSEAKCLQLAIQMQERKRELGYPKTFIVFGKTIFTKYIPGKVFLFIALIFYLNKFKISKTNGLAAMMNFQIISLWSGLIAGLGFLLAGKNFSPWLKFNALIFIVIFAAVIIVKPIQKLLDKIAQKILRREISIFHYPAKQVWQLILFFMLTWLLNGVGFYLLIGAKTSLPVLWQAILIFPLARTVGTLSVITPGGLGVREGAIAGLLSLCGLSLPVGVAISVLARIWSFIGELFAYLLALFFEKNSDLS